MSISADLSAVQTRIDEITGVVRPPATRSGGPSALQPARLGGTSDPRLAAPVRSETRPEAFGALVTGAYERLARSSGLAAGVDPALVAAVAQTESGFDPRATSRTGAAGLMQLMPATASSLGVADPYDPAQNVRGGAAYLHALLERFHASVPLALAAYNAGPGAVERYGGIPPYVETQAYVDRVMAAYRARGGM